MLAVKASGFCSGKSSSFWSSRISWSWEGDQVLPGGKVEWRVERETILLRHQRVLIAMPKVMSRVYWVVLGWVKGCWISRDDEVVLSCWRSWSGEVVDSDSWSEFGEQEEVASSPFLIIVDEVLA